MDGEKGDEGSGKRKRREKKTRAQTGKGWCEVRV